MLQECPHFLGCKSLDLDRILFRVMEGCIRKRDAGFNHFRLPGEGGFDKGSPVGAAGPEGARSHSHEQRGGGNPREGAHLVVERPPSRKLAQDAIGEPVEIPSRSEGLRAVFLGEVGHPGFGTGTAGSHMGLRLSAGPKGVQENGFHGDTITVPGCWARGKTHRQVCTYTTDVGERRISAERD